MNYIPQMIRFLLIPLILCFTLLPSYSVIKGKVENTIPFDYTKINQAEMETTAEGFYSTAIQSEILDDNMTSALNLYSVLSDAYPDNINYPLKVGKLYDVLRKDRYAKGYYFRAMNIDKSNPEPYFCLGNFYYEREQYRKALKFYLKAYEYGNILSKEKINTIYEKLGESARI